jgi:DNA-binding MarR family transcriptional regulator
MKKIPGFDPIIHVPARLQLVSILCGVDDMEFATIRELLQVSDSVLSKHVALLVGAGYVDLRKMAVMGRQRTWLSMTKRGQKAYKGHVFALQSLMTQSNLNLETKPARAKARKSAADAISLDAFQLKKAAG